MNEQVRFRGYHHGDLRNALKNASCEIFDDPALRQLLKDVKRLTEIRIDTVSTDAVVSSGYDEKKARDAVGRFKSFLDLRGPA